MVVGTRIEILAVPRMLSKTFQMEFVVGLFEAAVMLGIVVLMTGFRLGI